VAEVAAQIAEYDAKVAAMIADDEDLITYVSRLEDLVDEIEDDGELESELDLDDDPERLADEVEQFLRSQDPDT
jgi:hypothetical protein